jgi:lysozyme
MNFSAAGLDLLKRSEGFRSHVYKDAAGYPTIGYGHRLWNRDSFADGIDEAQAALILMVDVRDAVESVQRLVTVPLSQGQFDALVDFVYNLGQGKLAKSTLLKKLNAGDYDAAAEQFPRWDHIGVKVNDDLKVRREAEVALWQNQPVNGPATPAEG